MTTVYKNFAVEISEKRPDGGRILITTPTVDRDQDRIFPMGMRTDNYFNNGGVVQWGHNYRDPFATIGKTKSLEVSPNGIVADFDLRPAANESDPQNIVRLLWEGGWVKTASVGFIPLKGKPNNVGGMDFEETELLEWSLVPIPANPSAVALSVAKMLGGNDTDLAAKDALRAYAQQSKDGNLQNLTARQYAQYEAYEELAKEFGAFDWSSGANGAHYMPAALNPFAGAGLKCANCVLYRGAACEIVMGDIEPDAVCKLWVIPEALIQTLGVTDATQKEIETKRGRVLSAANEAKLTQARDHLNDVLAQIAETNDEAGKALSADIPNESNAAQAANENSGASPNDQKEVTPPSLPAEVAANLSVELRQMLSAVGSVFNVSRSA